MRIDIQTRGFALTDSIRNHCERRMRFALGPTSGHLTGIAIRLADVNGPKGGADKRCMIKATIPGAPTIVVGQEEPNLYAAIDLAADRMARTLSRRLQRTWRDRRGAVHWQTPAQNLNLEAPN